MADPPLNPADDDVRHDDLEFDPALEPKSAKAWLNLLEESEKAFDDWNDHCDNIDKRYANLERLTSKARAREFQMFWANTEVIKPSIYAKPPVPVVVPKFKDRRPVYQAASELLERCCVVSFDLAHINELMLQVRDDVVLYGRGVPWCRYEKKGEGYYAYEKVCVDHKGRRDFLHSLSRCWYEVEWVAAASYLTRAQARDRFKKYSGYAYQDAEYKVDRDAKEIGGTDNRERAKFWEIWHKGEQRVVWVAKGCEDILDEDEPHLELQDFFPCPCPAYGTVQPGSLIPVPEVLQYEDQLDEINELTGRIHALSAALTVKGFYPGGGGETRRSDRDRDQDQHAGRGDGADQQLGRLRRLERDHHLDADRGHRGGDHAIDHAAQADDRRHLPDHRPGRHHARLDRRARDARRAGAQDPVRLDAHQGQAAGAGALRARPGGDLVRHHDRRICAHDADRDEPDAIADRRRCSSSRCSNCTRS